MRQQALQEEVVPAEEQIGGRRWRKRLLRVMATFRASQIRGIYSGKENAVSIPQYAENAGGTTANGNRYADKEASDGPTPARRASPVQGTF
jgi:hypothetical protein